jgi:2-polyprenyl-3-methyl-5-hydroxy-6-metoxy-1,4-benzoquinol methylase
MKSGVQDKQEQEYAFPYHYISRRISNNFSQHFVDTWGINYISTIEFMLNKIASLGPSSIVDIGCGDGRLTREIFLENSNKKVLGIDYSERAIKLAQAMNSDLSGIEFKSIDITSRNSDEKFDLAVLMEVYEHIPLDATCEFLAGVRSLIKPGGLLLLTVPHTNKPLEYKHFQHFTIEGLSNQLSNHFEVIEVVPFEKRGLLRRLLNFCLCNRFVVFNNRRLLNYLYRFHEKYLFRCNTENECQRIFVLAKPKAT